MTQKTAVSILYKWFKENIDTFKAQDAEIEFKDSGQGEGYVRVDTVKHMSDLSVKDKKFYLLLEMIDRETDESTYPHTTDCKTQEEFEKQLQLYLEWFNKVHS